MSQTSGPQVTLINHQGLKVLEGIQLQSPSPSIGLAYIGAYLKKHGVDYQAIDACGLAMDHIRPYRQSKNIFIQGLSTDEIVARVVPGARIIGLTCLFSHCWPLVLEIAGALRVRFPEALLVVGGEHATADAERSLNEGPFDVVVNGEGEETFLELARLHLAGEDWCGIRGIAYLKTNGTCQLNEPRKRITAIDDFPWPDWDSWCIEAYIANQQVTGIHLGRSIPFLGSRGCPYDCKFCSNDGMWTRRYLVRSAKGIVDEMEHLKAKYRLDGFTFMDLTFIVNRAKTKEFAQELIARNLGINYQLPAGTRCEAFDDELAQLLEQSGLKNFAFAPESGDETILKAIRKQISLPKFFEAVRIVLKTRMTVGSFFVIGVPEETPATLRNTLGTIRKLAWLGIHDVTVSQFTPYPGSDYFRMLEKQGKVCTDATSLEQIINFYSSRANSYCPAVSNTSLHRWMLWMYLNFYVISFTMRPWRLLMNLADFAFKGVENTRYMRLFGELFVRRGKWQRRSDGPGSTTPVP